MHREEWPHLAIQPGHVHCCPPQRAKLSIEYLMGLSITPASTLHPHMAKLLLTFGPAANKVRHEAKHGERRSLATSMLYIWWLRRREEHYLWA